MNNNNKNPEGLCQNMKDAREVFDESLKSISGMLDSNNVKGSFFLSSYLTTFAHMSNDSDGVFIAEILENVFSQVGPLLEDEKVSQPARMHAIALLKKPLKGIVDNYCGDKNKLYLALRDLRVQATSIQFMCWKETINSDLCGEKSE